MTLLASERKKQLQDRHDVLNFLMSQFKEGESVWYWVLVDQRDGHNVYKAGYTDNIAVRYKGWKHDYPMCFLRHVVRIGNRDLEKRFQ